MGKIAGPFFSIEILRRVLYNGRRKEVGYPVQSIKAIPFPKRHIWLLADLLAIGLYFLLREDRALMNAFTAQVTQPLKDAVASLCYLVPFSVAEWLYAAFFALCLGWTGWSLHRIRTAGRGRRLRALWGGGLGLLCLLATAYAAFCLVWGVNYYTDSFQERSGIYAQPVSVEELYRVTALMAEGIDRTAPLVERDERGVFAEDRQEILEKGIHAYDALSQTFPFLAREDRVPKPMFFSKVFSAMGFTGFYCGYTGESNLNVDSPVCFLPATVAHELAHQRGIASEQECNFLAVLAATTMDDPVYQYSGYLMAYVHLGNALWQADPDLWRQLRDGLCPQALTDLADNSAYWAAWEGPAETVSNKVYDGLLKSYGQADGIRSYGTVVDLLVAYY